VSPFRQRLALYGLLASCVAGAVWCANSGDSQAADLSDTVSAPAPKLASAEQVTSPAVELLPLAKLNRMFVAADNGNPFGVKSWAPPVAPVVQPKVQEPGPVAPVAPPLPFTFAGKLDLEPGKWVVYLAKGDQSFSVSQGETFDGAYRLDGIADGNLVIIYSPLGTKQLLPIGMETSE